MPLPSNYAERVYAGVLGKLIGVYLGRPFEGWTYERILAELGEINGYVHERLNMPLVVTDDDIAGTFTFLRALADYNYDRQLSPRQIGQTWLNYLIEGRTVLWWGGLGNSTEHTAYLRLKQGIYAPQSGSHALNGKVVAEQIGAQIFIDGWAMVAPGDPELAADLARRAGSVSHDGEAIYAAQLLAAMEAQAFVENDRQTLLDIGLSFLPHDSLIFRMVQDIREWHSTEPDWQKTRARLATHYGYDLYGGNCHVVPNHALIILALLYGDDQLQKTLMIVNTSGWDTDCNSGNVGCLLGIKNGLSAFEGGPDWRGPVADRLYLSTADGGRAITDAVTETYHIVQAGHALAGKPFEHPKQGARFHFSLPGSLQGFRMRTTPVALSGFTLENAQKEAGRCLALHYEHLLPAQQIQLLTDTFIPPEAIIMPGSYALQASPTLYTGQTIQAHIIADDTNTASITGRLFVDIYDEHDHPVSLYGPPIVLAPAEICTARWRVPDTAGAPICAVGLVVSSEQATSGSVYIESLTWDGAPEVTLTRPEAGGMMWQRAWVNAVDYFENQHANPYRLIQNTGRGMVIQGTREWTDYVVNTTVIPHLVQKTGIGVRVQGLQRYYAVMLSEQGKASLIKMLDGETILAESTITWELDRVYALRVEVVKAHLKAWLDGELLFDVHDDTTLLSGGGVAFICQEGRMEGGAIHIQPLR